MMLPLNPKNPAHPRDNIAERGLRFFQFSGDLDLDGGKYSYFRADHFLRDFDLGPAAKVRPSLRRGMQGAGFVKDYFIRCSTDNLTGPAHPRVDAEKALLGRQGFKDFSDTFGFAHENIIT